MIMKFMFVHIVPLFDLFWNMAHLMILEVKYGIVTNFSYDCDDLFYYV